MKLHHPALAADTPTVRPPEPIAKDLASQWMLKPGLTFLNHGSFGAMPRAVLDEQEQWRRRIEAEPVEIIARRWPRLLDGVKQSVGALLGMRPEDFGLVTNATEGINAVLRSLELRPGDELLTTDHVYNAVRQAMKFAAGRSGGSYREVAVPMPVLSADEIAQRVIDAVNEKTRLLVIDHVTSPTALVFPVERIVEACRDKGVDVLVDGAHAPGMLDLDVEAIGAAYYAGNLHKWVCAPRGSGFIWAREDRRDAVHPLVISHKYGKGLAAEFEWQGTRDVSAWLAIPKAIEFMASLGWERVQAHNHALATWAQQMLSARWGTQPLSPADGSLLGSMATVVPPGRMAALSPRDWEVAQQHLYDEYRIESPLVPFAGRTFVRVACQVYNTPADVERLACAIEAMASV